MLSRMTNDVRYDIGWERLTRLNGTDDPRVVARVRELSPEMADWLVAFGYGDAYDEVALPVHDRQLATIGALTALGGCEAQLQVHARIALRAGLSPVQLIAAVAHLVPYCGFPRAINALEAVRPVIERYSDVLV